MRQFNKIVQSETAPNINSFWMKNGQLLWFNNGEWIPVVKIPKYEKHDTYDDSALIKRIENLEAKLISKDKK